MLFFNLYSTECIKIIPGIQNDIIQKHTFALQSTLMTKALLIIFVNSLLYLASAAQADSNIVIANASHLYNFDYSRKDKAVNIKQELSTTYQCVNFRTSITVAEFYDNVTDIDNVKIYVDGKQAKYIFPKYEPYTIDNIFYSDAQVCYLRLPLEKKGSTSEVQFEITKKDPRYFTSIYFSEPYNISNKTVSVTVPRWMKVELKELNFAGQDIKKTTEYNSKKDADVITYSIKNLAASVKENNSPGSSYTEPHLLVLCKYADLPDGKISYFNNLDDQYAWYYSLIKDLESNTNTVKSKALEITEGVSNDLDKIKKVLYWMHDNIRYIAFEDGISGFKPDRSEEVLRKKYGDCKGMANLTKGFLKALGFDARLCWIGTNHIAYDYTTPSLAVDNHMITALLYKGKTYFLDATENYLGFNEYAERIQGRQVLIEDGAKYIYTKVPSTTFAQNLDIEKSTVSIAGPNLEGNVSREWTGEEKELMIARLSATRKENTNDAFIKFLGSNNNNYNISNFTTSKLDDYDKPLNIHYTMKYSNALSAFDNELYVDLDNRKDFSDFTFDLTKRTKDYWFSFKTNTQIEVQLTLPAAYSITALPAPLNIKNNDYEFTAGFAKQPGKLIYTKHILIKNPKLSRSKFEQWNSDIEKLKEFYNQQIVLKKN